MNATHRYALHKARYNETEDPMQDHLDNLAKMIKSSGMGLLGALDSYIITMIKTRDRRRALIDIDSIPMAAEAIEKAIVNKVASDISNITKEINRQIQ